ncbi:interferon-inducible double-stranded RNA-dependent protein kinase activator A homolog [Drosophila subpulchrella]|uniref:interferon-inducible double-stranded RNA-dependent protein kinase activator A homolog n=1 Tax=Drosophila subpulchrella TaxID=1486046 RepID=UPI0018A16CC5|nr:interferon-inducible double-stranded RNA-dependent protein kinase activator A homolog [Drosophila subpulchrella]
MDQNSPNRIAPTFLGNQGESASKEVHEKNSPSFNFKATEEELKFVRESRATKQPLGILQEMLSRRGIVLNYDIVHTEVAAGHVLNYWYRVFFMERELPYFALGTGRSKKAAKHDAAGNLTELICGSPRSGPNSDVLDDAHSIRRLNELCIGRRWPPPEYDFEASRPEDHYHTVACSVLEYREEAKAFTKKQGKRLAAKQMCDRLLQEPVSSEEVQQIDDGVLNVEEWIPKPRLGEKLMPKPEMGNKLMNIQETCLKNTKIEHKKLLDEVAAENGYNITYVDIDEASFTGKFQCLVVISTSPVGICPGTGASVEEAQSNAAQNSLEYMKILTQKGESIEQAIAKLN